LRGQSLDNVWFNLILALGKSTVPVTSGGNFSRLKGLAVPIMGHDTGGVAICNRVCSFDIEARVRSGNASYIETLDTATIDEIVSRVISVIDPENVDFR